MLKTDCKEWLQEAITNYFRLQKVIANDCRLQTWLQKAIANDYRLQKAIANDCRLQKVMLKVIVNDCRLQKMIAISDCKWLQIPKSDFKKR